MPVPCHATDINRTNRDRPSPALPLSLCVYVYCVFEPFAISGPLGNDFLDPSLLPFPHFLLEGLHLLPAVQRPAVVLPETLDNLAPRVLHPFRHVAHLSPLIELGPQSVELLGHGLAVDLVGGWRGRLVLGREGLLERLGFFGPELLQLLGDAGLDLQLRELCAGGVGLKEKG